MSIASDADRIARSLEEPEAFGAIFDRHAATVLRYLVRRVGRTTGEALLADVFQTAFEVRERFDTRRDSALPWLYGIASNLVLKHLRTEGRRLRATARMASEAGGHGCADRVEATAAARLALGRVAEAMEGLPAVERDALLLFAWEGLSYDEIAEAQDVPLGTVRSRISRARARVRERISPSGKEQETARQPVSPERCRP